MTPTASAPATGGLVGLLKTAKLPAVPAVDPLRIIIWLVALAGMNAVWTHSGAPLWGFEHVMFNLTLGFAGLMAEYYLSREVCRCWHERSALPMVGFFAIWAGAFVYSCNAWLGVASDGQANKTNLHKTAHIASADVSKTVARFEAKLGAERAELRRLRDAAAYKTMIAGVEITTPAAAQALIDGAKSHRFWGVTNSCSETKGPQTREYCAAYRSAEAALATVRDAQLRANEAKAQEKLVAQTEADLDTARRAQSTTPVVAGDERSDLRILMSYGKMSEQQAMDIQAMLKIGFISLLLSGLGFLHEGRKHRHLPKKPWPFFAWLRRLIFGAGPVGTDTNPLVLHSRNEPLILRETIMHKDPSWARLMEEMQAKGLIGRNDGVAA